MLVEAGAADSVAVADGVGREMVGLDGAAVSSRTGAVVGAETGSGAAASVAAGASWEAVGWIGATTGTGGGRDCGLGGEAGLAIWAHDILVPGTIVRLAAFCGAAGRDSSAAGAASVAASVSLGVSSAQVAGVLDDVASSVEVPAGAASAPPSGLAHAPAGVGAAANEAGVDELTSSALSPSTAAPLIFAPAGATAAEVPGAARGAPLTPIKPPRPPRPPRMPPRPPRAPSVMRTNESACQSLHESCMHDTRAQVRTEATATATGEPATLRWSLNGRGRSERRLVDLLVLLGLDSSPLLRETCESPSRLYQYCVRGRPPRPAVIVSRSLARGGATTSTPKSRQTKQRSLCGSSEGAGP